MTLIWNSKNNFILLHSIALCQYESSIENINWSLIVQNINLEIKCSPSSLKAQYQNLLNNFHPITDATTLYSRLKFNYLNSLCQQIKDNKESSLEIVYELIRHIRARRIHISDIQQLINQWKYGNPLEEEEEEVKIENHLLQLLIRLRHYIQTQSKDFPISSLTNDQDHKFETVSDDDIEKKQSNTNQIGSEKLIPNRRRAQSLTVHPIKSDHKVNIGLDWFVPKLQRQQRSSSLHIQDISSTRIGEKVSNETNLRQTNAHPTITWLPLTDVQIAEKQSHQSTSKCFDDDHLDDVSPSSSDSNDSSQDESNSHKRKKLC